MKTETNGTKINTLRVLRQIVFVDRSAPPHRCRLPPPCRREPYDWARAQGGSAAAVAASEGARRWGDAPAAYQPPAGSVSGALSTEVLLDLLARRAAARKARDFATSDSLRDQMRALGIYPDDTSRTWTTADGRSGSLEGPDFFAPPGTPSAGSAALVAPSASYISDTQIADLLAQREVARMSRDYSRADELRSELNRHGVSTDDRVKTWRAADGRSGTMPGLTGGFSTSGYGGAAAYGGYGAQVRRDIHKSLPSPLRNQETVKPHRGSVASSAPPMALPAHPLRPLSLSHRRLSHRRTAPAAQSPGARALAARRAAPRTLPPAAATTPRCWSC